MSNCEKKRSILDHSDLLQEWDWERNQQLGITPQKVTPGSTRKLFWKCKHGHIWQATPANRYRGQGCPVCAGRKVLAGFNDFASKHPEPAREWHTKKNSFMPWEVTSHSNKRVWWKCEKCSNEWITSVNNRAMGKGCPICGREKQIKARANNRIEKHGSFAANYPDILIEWDYEKNSSNPELLTKNSTERTWWKCKKCGYSWVTTVMHRTTRRSGCPACANKKTTVSNCLQTTHPHVLLKWNYRRNENIAPNDVTAGSNKKVWWICDKGHEWESAVTSIVNGGQCPICCGQRVLQGYNDLATVNPELSKEWHPVKNGNLLPIHVTAGSTRNKVWWVCAYGHEYQARIADRNKGTGCPICDKERKTSFPEQTIYFYLRKITQAENRYLYGGKCEIDIFLPKFHIGIEYDGLYYHAGINAKAKEQKKEEFLRNEGIRLIRIKEVKVLSEYQDRDDIIYCVNNGQYGYLENVIWKILQRIPQLADKKKIIDIDIERDSIAIMSEYICSEKEKSLAIRNPVLAAEWHPTRNGYIKPEMISCASGKKVWWMGRCGHEWAAVVINRAAGNGCPICANKVVLAGFNDLETTHPELAKEWDYAKNGVLSPKKVTYGSDKKVWWMCTAGHSYTSTIANRYYGKGCPYCSNVKVLCGFNDLLSQCPDIAEEWLWERNDDTPDHILPGSNKKVWWRCKTCSHEWKISPNHRVYRSSGCPACCGRVATEEENLYVANSALCLEWDYLRNSELPTKYREYSNKKVWWVCSKCGYNWQAQISERSNGTGCPCCAGKIVVSGVNDFASIRPELVHEWNTNKNEELKPNGVTAYTHKKVWWLCSRCGHEWCASVANRSRGRGCPKCANNKSMVMEMVDESDS